MRADHPDVVTIDLMMPGVGGLELLALKRTDPDLSPMPSLVVTAVGWQEDLDRAKEMGATAVLLKPFSQQELAQAVRRILPADPEEPPAR
jgi:CheY-like chemotaxis protein